MPAATEKEYLARANDAEEKANKAESTAACARWLELAEFYREMAVIAREQNEPLGKTLDLKRNENCE